MMMMMMMMMIVLTSYKLFSYLIHCINLEWH